MTACLHTITIWKYVDAVAVSDAILRHHVQANVFAASYWSLRVLDEGGRPVGGGGCVGCVRTPKLVKCKIKNTDIVYNAPCIEERSTFLQKKPVFHSFFTKHPSASFFTFLQKHPPISFPAYGPGRASKIDESVVQESCKGCWRRSL